MSVRERVPKHWVYNSELDTVIWLSRATRQKAESAAATLGIELNEFVRFAVEAAAENANRAQLRTGSADNFEHAPLNWAKAIDGE